MFAKTSLLTAAAFLALGAAPALAQDMPTQDTPPASQPAAPGALTLQPGSDVKGSDGAVLGKLEGVTTVSGAQQLSVRGADGVVRGVPLAGLQPDGAGVKVGMTSAEFQAAAAVPEDPAAQPNPPAPQPTPQPETPPATPPN